MVRHVGWLINHYAVRADGKTGYERLRGRPYSGKVLMFGECVWYRPPETAHNNELEERWHTALWLGKTNRSDEHLVFYNDEVKTARSVRRKEATKRWNRRLLEAMSASPWLPRPRAGAAETSQRPNRYITKGQVSLRGATENCPGCVGRSTYHSDACKRRFRDLWAAEAQAEALAESAVGGATAEATTAEAATATASPAIQNDHAATIQSDPVTPIQNDPAAMDVTMTGTGAGSSTDPAMGGATLDAGMSEHKRVSTDSPPSEPASLRQRVAGVFPVCRLEAPEQAVTPVNYVATRDLDHKTVLDSMTGEPLDAELVKQGRARERANAVRHGLYERVGRHEAKGSLVRSMWLDSARVDAHGQPFVRSRLVAMQFNSGERLDVFSGTPPLKFIKLIVSRAATARRTLGFFDVEVAFWHADLPEDEAIAVYPPRGEEPDDVVWQLKKAMYGTRVASKLFGNLMVEVYGAAGYIVLKSCRQLFYNKEFDSLSGLWGDDGVTESTEEGHTMLEQHLQRHLHVKILGRVGPGRELTGRYLKRVITYVDGEGFEWLEDPRHIEQLVSERGKANAKPIGSPCSKDSGKNDPQALDELGAIDARRYRSDVGRLLYVASGRYDLQFCTKRLGEHMSRPLRLGEAFLERAARYLASPERRHLALFFAHEPRVQCSRVPVDADWAGREDRYSTHSGVELVGSHMIDSWVATDQVRALSTAESELYGIIDGAARGLQTKHVMQECSTDWQVTVESDSAAGIGISARSGVGKVRHIQTRWLWIQDAVREKTILVKKCKGELNVADLGTKPLEPKRHQELLSMLPLRPPRGKRWLGAVATAACVEAAKANDVAFYAYWDVTVTGTIYLLIVVFVLGLVVGCALRNGLGGARKIFRDIACQTDAVTMKDAQGQSQTTYTAVRGTARPRFQVIDN